MVDVPNPEIIVGRYALYRRIASGGMATVYLGRLLGPVGFSRTVAIKRLLPQFARDPEFVTMFLDEARLAARLRHPNIVATLDVVATKGEAFLVMEYVQGESLAQLLRSAALQSEPIPPRIAASILSGALLGLHAAHEARDGRGLPLNLVHRDVSPHNILVGTDGTARLLDFGVAKAEGRAQHLTREGHIKGKLGYMAPEQLAGDGVTRESDIYSAAVVLWEALVGRKVFAGTHDAIAMVRAQHPRIDPPSRYRPELTSEMDEIVLKGMAWDPSNRFATAREMAAAIEKAVGPVSVLEVAEWLEVVAGQRIHMRAQDLLAFEHSSGGQIAVAEVAAELHTEQTAAVVSGDASEESTVRRPTQPLALPASDGPAPIEMTSQTSASTPRARSNRVWARRARYVGGIAALGALALLSAMSVAAVGARARARASQAAAEISAAAAPPASAAALAAGAAGAAAAAPVLAAGTLQTVSVMSLPSAPAAFASAAPAPAPTSVPVMSLPIASPLAPRTPAPAHRSALSRAHAPPAKPAPAPKTLSPFDAIGGRE